MEKSITLTIENAATVSTIISKTNPEWGTKRFNHNDQPLHDGRTASSQGCGSNSALLFDSEFKFWNVATFK